MKPIGTIILCALLLSAGPLRAAAVDDDVYGEEAIKSYKEGQREKPEWKEQDQAIPPYPKEKQLIRVDIGRSDFPYKVYVDQSSLSVAEDRVVRYTVVLRSKSGVDNVSFEGIRCNGRQYRRYAYGSGGEFHPVPRSEWRAIQRRRQDVYRNALVDGYFCPLPNGDKVSQIVRKLKGHGGDGGLVYPGDPE